MQSGCHSLLSPFWASNCLFNSDRIVAFGEADYLDPTFVNVFNSNESTHFINSNLVALVGIANTCETVIEGFLYRHLFSIKKEAIAQKARASVTYPAMKD